MRLRIGLSEFWILSHPDFAREIFVTQATHFAKGRGIQRARIFLGDSLFTSEGENHRRQRRLSQPAFHRARLQGYADAMISCAVQTRDRWHEGEEIDIGKEMNRLTLAIVGRTLFSADVEAEAKKVGDALTNLLENFNHLMKPLAPLLMKVPLPATREIKKARAKLDETIYSLIRERRANRRDTGDLLSMLVFAEDADHPGEGLDDEEVRDQALTLFIAGHETTSNVLTWTWWLLSQNPNVEAELHAELERVLGGRTPSLADVRSLGFTEKVVREALRLYPSIWSIGRTTLEPTVIGGYTIPRGAIAVACPWIIHRDPRFFPNPDVFQPDRWTPEFTDSLPKFAYFPFGGGARICIGENFTWMELVLVMATLAQRWRLTALPGVVARTHPGPTLRMESGVRFRAANRAPVPVMA